MNTAGVRRTLVAIGLAAALLASWPVPAFPQAKRGGVLTFALYQEPETLNPYIATQTASFEVNVFTVEGLLGVGPDGEYFPLLAKEVPSRQNGGVSGDGKTITYHFKDGLKWSDGQPVTCDDVRFTWQAIVDPKSGASGTTGYRDIETVDCPSPSTVVVRYKTFYAPFLSRFDAIMPRHAAGDPAEMPRWAYNRKPVGTGPFTMLEWVSGDHITFIPNRYYREAGKPYLSAVIIRITPSREVGKQLIKTGEIDVLWDLVESDVPELQPAAGVKISSAPSSFAERLVLNLADPTLDGPPLDQVEKNPHPILGDPRVREAIELGINKQEIIDKLLFGSWASGAFRKHGHFDVVLYTTNPDVDPQSQVEGYFASWSIPTAANSGAGFNYARWGNKTADENINLAKNSPDINARKKAYCAVMGEIVKDRPHIYLYDRSSIHAYRDRMQGWVTNVWDRLGWNAEDWSLR